MDELDRLGFAGYKSQPHAPKRDWQDIPKFSQDHWRRVAEAILREYRRITYEAQTRELIGGIVMSDKRPDVSIDSDHFKGPVGESWRVDLPDGMQVNSSIVVWLFDAPYAHPFWRNHAMYVVHLRPTEDFPEPDLHFEGATHEFGVMALDPENQPYTVASYLMAVDQTVPRGRSPYLTPHDAIEQVICTDKEAKLLAAYAARAVAFGHLIPDSDGSAAWGPSLRQTLLHIRNKPHGNWSPDAS